jgi:single-strand DNA-binding protein
MVNKVVLIGRLGKDPEVRYTEGGAAVATFSLATEESFKDRSGERQKRTEWHRIVTWEKLAEIAQQYLKKGMLVYIEGRIQSSEWEKDGVKQRSFEIVASTVRMLEGKHDTAPAKATAASEEQPQQSRGSSPASRKQNRTPPPAERQDKAAASYQADDSDIPF